MWTVRIASTSCINIRKSGPKAMLNIANMGYFSSDRTIQEYAKYIWHIDPVRL
jgi:hypothetical protein